MFNLIVSKFWFICLLIFTGCGCNNIYVQNRYITLESLASYHAGTPDPRKYCPDMGQCLTVHWSFFPEIHQPDSRYIEMTIRFRNREEIFLTIPARKTIGHYTYCLLNDEYWDKGGILTYKMDVFSNGELIQEWRHQLWAELIILQPEPDKSE